MTKKPPLAVYADLENISPKMLPVVVDYLSTAWELTLKRAYTNDLSQASRSMLSSLKFEHVEVKRHVKRKNAVDFCITCDIMEQFFLGDVRGFALLTSDPDFIEAVLRVKKCLPIYVFGADSTPLELQHAASEFKSLNKLCDKPNNLNHTASVAEQCNPEQLRDLIAQFVEEISSAGPPTVARFSAYLKQRAPGFTPARYGARSVSALLKRLGGFILTEITTEFGGVVDYHLALAKPQAAVVRPESDMHLAGSV